MKYKLDDYFGSMADYDYALSLDPTNVTAYYNRALLKMEVNENNKAIDDFSYVLKSEPTHVMARYNRASLYYKTGQYKKAIVDYDELLKTYPNFQMALYSRSECKRLSGDVKGAEKDYNRSYYLFNKIDVSNYYYNKSIMYIEKIYQSIIQLLNNDILKMEKGIDAFSDVDKLDIYIMIEEIILEYNIVYNVDLDKYDKYSEILNEYTEKVNEYTELVAKK